MKSKLSPSVNYIRHMDIFLDIVHYVDSINYTHIALYISLFRSWNLTFFNNPFSTTRDELLSYSGLKSKESFYRIIRELEALDLIRYYPSRSKYERSFFCLSTLEFTIDQIKISVWGLSNHSGLSNEQKSNSFTRTSGASNFQNINSKAQLHNGKGSIILEKVASITIPDHRPTRPLDDNLPYNPLTDPKYTSFLDHRISSPSNNNYHADYQNSKSQRSGLRPSGVQIDPDADYSVPL